MGLFAKISALIGASEPPPATARASIAAPGVPPPQPALPGLLWHEIIDASTRLAGYRLQAASSQALDGETWLALLRREGVEAVGKRRLLLIPMRPEQWLNADFKTLGGQHPHFELGAGAGGQLASWPALLHAEGASVALPADWLDSHPELGSLADVLLFDMHGEALPALEARLRHCRQRAPQARLMIENVRSWAEYRYLRAMGADYCQGEFSHQPDEEAPATECSPGRLLMIELLNLVRRDAELGELVEKAKREPAVVVKLIEMANTPLSGLARPVSSLDEAIMLLGREALYRWLAFSLFQIDPDNPRDEALLVMALTRANFLERIAPPEARSDLFLVGLFSLLDSLLRQPLPQLLERIQLPPPVRAVLLDNSGAYARYLRLLLTLENGQYEAACAFAASLAIPRDDLLANYGAAIAWANRSAH